MTLPDVLGWTESDADGDTRPRVVVTTDPELDDLNSMLRFLLYCNEVRVAGLVYASSQFHHSGDPASGVPPHRWPAPGTRLHIDEALDRYAEVVENLSRHADGYPTPDALRAVVAFGNVRVVGEYATDTPGSELIREVLLDDVPGRVFLGCWGGPSTVAAALRSIEEHHAHLPEWDRIREIVSRKAVLTAFGRQDPSFDEYIRPRWPDLELREVATTAWGYFARRSVLPEHAHYLSAGWMREHVSTVGPIGSSYRVWGDGKQMAAGDVEDYFGLAGLDADELRRQGYEVWIDPQEPGSWISEGDSSNFALLLGNGLRSWTDPTYGGWGGRQVRSTTDPRTWSNQGVQDLDPRGLPRDDYATARWFEDIQRDFAARLRWSATGAFADANHAPVASVPADELERRAAPGERVRLTGTASDPDGDDVEAWWWVYAEAGTCTGAVEAVNDGTATSPEWSVTVPEDARPGQTVHVIFQVRDNGTPSMTAYQRVVVTVVDLR